MAKFEFPPQERAPEYIRALLARAKVLKNSANKLRETDLRTAFFLITIGLEETMESYIIFSFAVGIQTEDEIKSVIKNSKETRHIFRQNMALRLYHGFQSALGKTQKNKHPKPYHQAKKLAKNIMQQQLLQEIKDDINYVDGLETLKQQCLYVDWDKKDGLIKKPVTPEILDEVLELSQKMGEIMFLLLDERRRVTRHISEFKTIIDELWVD